MFFEINKTGAIVDLNDFIDSSENLLGSLSFYEKNILIRFSKKNDTYIDEEYSYKV